jgi:hypothetical protein
MRKPPLFVAFCSTLLFACAIAQAAKQSASKPPAGEQSGRTYKWVDSQGMTHYGDSIPPEYAQGSRSELNSQGVEVRCQPSFLPRKRPWPRRPRPRSPGAGSTTPSC